MTRKLIEVRSSSSDRVVGYADQITYHNFYGRMIPVYASIYGYQTVLKQYKVSKLDEVTPGSGSFQHPTNVENFNFKTEIDGRIRWSRFEWGKLPFISTKTVKIPDTDVINVVSMVKDNCGYYQMYKNPYKEYYLYVPLKPILSKISGSFDTIAERFMSSNIVLQSEILLTEEFCHELFKLLRKYSSVPILEDWIPYLISNNNTFDFKLCRSYYADLESDNNVVVVNLNINDNFIESAISDGLRQGLISINGSNQVSNEVRYAETLTDYLQLYSSQLIDKAAQKFTPIFNPEQDSFNEKEKDYFDYAEYYGKLKFFEAQKNVIASISRSLNKNKSCLLIGEMGSGKTAVATAAIFLNSKKKNTNNIIMCPGHLVEKWRREINRLYPEAECYIISDFNTLLNLENKINDKRRNYPLFFIISKDTAKINYAEEPAVNYNPTTGLFYCPDCGNVLSLTKYYSGSPRTVGKRRLANYPVLKEVSMFLVKNNYNTNCKTSTYVNGFNRTRDGYYTCGSTLWQAINSSSGPSKWIKLNVGFIHKDMIPKIKSLYERINNYSSTEANTIRKLYKGVIEYEEALDKKIYAPRRYSIAKYIREKYKGNFDYFIADEVHMYSSNSSAQSGAFGDFVKTANKTLALTGTLLNGYADGIYHILYRMYPRTFTSLGFKYGSTQKFVEAYGVSKTISVRSANSYRNIKKSTRTLPGVSPKLFSNFLLDKAVFISLEDMSSGLPEYKEIPVGVPMEEFTAEKYQDITEQFKDLSDSDDKFSVAFAATMKMSIYPDQPYNIAPIYDRNNKVALTFPDAITEDEAKEYVSNKDLKTLEIVRKHIDRGENVLIYVNYVNKTECVQRLEQIFKAANIKYCVLDSKIAAKDRESWIDAKVKDGARVMICNPSLVETGLDLLSFTTIIFYQVGYNLFTMRQASRRSLRLNQPNNVTVYFLYYMNTLQESILSLMANKLQAAMAVEGKFSEEGLNAMSNNDSILTQIADSLVKNIQYKIEEGSFSTGLGTPEDDDGSRFQLVYMLNDVENKDHLYSLLDNISNKKSKKYNFEEAKKILLVG